MAIKVSSGPFGPLPVVLFRKSLVFLDAREVALYERVSRAWKIAIDSQVLWKAFCALEKIPIDSEQSLKRNYKQEFRSIVRVCVELTPLAPISTRYPTKVTDACGCNIAVQLHQKKGNKQQLPREYTLFPQYVPLNFFLNHDGSYKKQGDLVRLIFLGKHYILTCSPFWYGGRQMSTWEGGVEQLVNSYCKVVSNAQKNFQHEKMCAKANSYWIDNWVDEEVDKEIQERWDELKAGDATEAQKKSAPSWACILQ